jgi:hypothetical protein
VDLAGVVATYFDDLLGSDGAEWFYQLASSLSDGGSVPIAKLQVRLVSEFLADGWVPPAALELPFDDDLRVNGDDESAASAHTPQSDEDAAAFQARVDRALARASTALPGTLVEVRVEALSSEVVQLRQAMASRATIEQAKGIVMGSYSIDADRAWAYLVRVSQERGQKVRDIAEEIIVASSNGSGPTAA